MAPGPSPDPQQTPSERIAALAARWRSLAASTPAEHRPLVEAAVGQWTWLLTLAVGGTEPGPGPVALAVDAPRRLLQALGAGGRDGPAPTADLARLEGLLAAVAVEAAGDLAAHFAAAPLAEDDPERRLRAVYDVFVDAWERRYATLVASDDFARLQGRLMNQALRARRAGDAR